MALCAQVHLVGQHGFDHSLTGKSSQGGLASFVGKRLRVTAEEDILAAGYVVKGEVADIRFCCCACHGHRSSRLTRKGQKRTVLKTLNGLEWDIGYAFQIFAFRMGEKERDNWKLPALENLGPWNLDPRHN